MEFDHIVVKESPGLCRCCLSEGCYKDLAAEYIWMNETEVYADMLLECFDISISQHSDGPNGMNRLICEVCITRLRDACNFKKQVLDSEKKFVDMLGRGEFAPKVLLYENQLKTETDPQVGTSLDEVEVEYLEDLDFGDDDDVKNEDSEVDTSDITVSALPTRKRGRPPKIKSNKEKKLKSSTSVEKSKTSKAASKGVKIRLWDNLKLENNDPEIDRKVENISNVLMHSNATPFRWSKGRFECYYCSNIDKNISKLLYHMEIAHEYVDPASKTRRLIRRSRDYAVKVEVTGLECSKCHESAPNLEALINHLIIQHDINYDKDVDNCFVPFILSQKKAICATCGSRFDSVDFAIRHANQKHLSHPYLCMCGSSFPNEMHYLAHHRQYHQEGGYKCSYCNEVFESNARRTTHENRFHIDSSFECTLCPKRFRSAYFRKMHQWTCHGALPSKCPRCPKIFPYKSLMIRHLKRHLKEKSLFCEKCGAGFYAKHILEEHVLKHSGERNFLCAYCAKPFNTKNALRRHIFQAHKGKDF